MIIKLNMFFTCAIAVLLIFGGNKIRKKIKFFRKFCIPAPVIGGLLFSGIMTVLNMSDLLHLELDMVLNDFFMLLFYSSIGFAARIDVLRKGGHKVFIFLFLSICLVFLQNAIGIIIAKIINESPLIGLICGSVSMTGGHGTAAAFAPLFKQKGIDAALSISIAAATFGLISGGLLGGPIGQYLIKKRIKRSSQKSIITSQTYEKNFSLDKQLLFNALCLLFGAIALGNAISNLLDRLGFTFPLSVGAMLASAFFVNVPIKKEDFNLPISEISVIGNISLQFFLAHSIMTIKPWQLIDLALPMIIILLGQVIITVIFCIFITYSFIGQDYTAAVIASGHCGFGLGAVPTAMANMSAIEHTYGNCKEAFIIVPLVGSLFINFFNSVIVTIFINYM